MVRRLFALPGYGRLAAVFALTEFAFFVGTLALSVLIYRRTGSTLDSTSFFLCSQAVPAVIAPPIVARLDRASPRTLLPVLFWSEAVVFGVLVWLTARFSLAPALALVVLDGTIALIARSLAAGARTELLKPVGLVREGGAVQSMMFSIAYLLAPLLAGLLSAIGGTVAALYVDCGLFVVMGVMLLSDAIPRQIVHEGPERGRLRAAFAYIRRQPPVAILLALETVAFVFFGIPTAIEVVYAIHTLHAGTAGYGVLLSIWGGGAVAGSLLYARWRRRRAQWLIAIATGLIGVGFGVLALAPEFALALLGAAIAGVGNGLCAAAFSTELNDIVAQSWVALVTSLNQSILQLAPALGLALGGVIAALTSPRVAFGVGATACLLLAALAGALLGHGRASGSRDPAAAGSRPLADVDPTAGEGASTPAETIA